jgi:FAD:protein FMN transferase
MKKYLALLLIAITIGACRQEAGVAENTFSEVKGSTMGTYYRVVYNSSVDYQSAIDSLLIDINLQVSTYDTSSLISQFNQGTELTIDKNQPKHFSINLAKAREIHQKTDGFFDPTVMPLVYYWGFAKNKKAVEEADPEKIKTLVAYVGLEKVKTTKLESGEEVYTKSNPNVQLDFSAIAKGYAVDQVGLLLENVGIKNYLVEIGGETVTKGTNPQGKTWTIGIVEPTKSANPNSDHNALVQIGNKGMATSGNYQNFYEVKGKKYGHTINPKTGYSAMSNILSASVVADDCMTADGYATGFMAMGVEKALEIANALPGIEAFFIYSENGEIKVKYTDGMKDLIIKM